MSKAPTTFKQTDVTKALKAVRAAGVEARVEIGKDGKIVVIMNKSANATDEGRGDEWGNI